MSNWLKYNISQQTYNPKTVNDVVTNKYDKIHKEIYDKALKLAIFYHKDSEGNYVFEHKDISEYNTADNVFYGNYIFLNKDKNNLFIEVDNINNASTFIDLDDYKIIEISNSIDYALPSKVLVTQRGVIHNEDGTIKINRFTIDLTEYWNNYFEITNEYIESDDLITNNLDDWYNYNDIVEYNYITGKATLENRVEMKKRKIDFKKISINDEIKIDYELE